MKKMTLAAFAWLLLTALAWAQPPMPGANFVWVPEHVGATGFIMPGHWQYQGPDLMDKDWVPGHYNARGQWVDGHWKVRPTRPDAGRDWVPGHRAANGRWVAGHWR